MTSAVLLQYIADAKKAHMRWVKRAEHLISGLPIDKDFIPLDNTKCGFGEWLYDTGEKLKLLVELENIMIELEDHHTAVHDAYMDIYKIYFVIPENRSILEKLFKSNKIDDEDKEKAKTHFKYLKKSSNDLLETLTLLEKKVANIPYSKIDRLFV